MIIETQEQLNIYQEAGKISKKVLESALMMVRPGIKTIDIDAHIYQQMVANKVKPWFSDVEDYKHSSCISINDGWIHGIPNEYIIKNNDVVKIDLGVKMEGLHVDNCWTIVANNNKIENPFAHFDHESIEVKNFLEQSLLRLNNAISKAVINNRIGDISNEMYQLEETDGYFVIREFVGHGIGYKNWESPSIPCYGTKNTGKKLKKGMVLAIEIMASMGTPLTKTAKDNWTIHSLDSSITSMFEHTVIVEENSPNILTYI